MRRPVFAAAAAAALLAAGLAGAAQPAPAAPLFDGLGAYHWDARTRTPLAQRYFDQAVLFAYGFNPLEAARSFRAAAGADPACAICWWGVAWALGPNVNADMDPASNATVADALARATALAAGATPPQRGLIRALAARHPAGAPIDEHGYARRMRALAARYPADADVAVLAAEAIVNLHPYDWWNADGTPKPWTPALTRLLERAMAASPGHPGALHYWIHVQELSARPARAEAAADRLARAAPGVGHLAHMPAHVYMRVGRYADAAAAGERAIAADARYLATVDAQRAYRVGYVAHDQHFLWAAAGMQGRAAVALEAARAAWPAACGPRGRDMSSAIVQHFYALPWLTLVRFARWQEILRGTLPPDVAEPYPNAIWHYARGTALARTGRAADARDELATLDRLAADPALAGLKLKNLNAATSVVEIARLTLRADIAAAGRDFATAVPLLERATAIEDSFEYDEPHLWLAPTRHALGAALLDAGRPREARDVYLKDLAHYPGNGWSLAGLARAQRALGDAAAATRTERAAAEAFSAADSTIASSRL